MFRIEFKLSDEDSINNHYLIEEERAKFTCVLLYYFEMQR